MCGWIEIYLLLLISYCECTSHPNIVFILADDLGWADVSWNDPSIISPKLEELKDESLVLDNYYVYQSCTPSRGAIMTGYYAHSIGLQHGVFKPSIPSYVPLGIKLLPERLKELGYSTAAVGKWHLGFCDWQVTPTYRGLDQFHGIYAGGGDHFTHEKSYKGLNGYDYRDNENIDEDQRGIYSTISQTAKAVEIIDQHNTSKPLYLYLSYQSVHKPMQVPQEYIDMYDGLGLSGERLTLAAMVTIMDEGIGNVTQVLKDRGIFKDTIIVFSSDNGAPVQDGGLNYPYRGSKATLFEGGTKVPAFIHYKKFKKGHFKGLFHAVDWYPTLVGAAGSSEPHLSMDGIDQWESLLQKQRSRFEFVYNLNEKRGQGAIRVGKFKLIIGKQGTYDHWYSNMSDVENYQHASKLGHLGNVPGFPQISQDNHMLFDLDKDPYEQNDLSESKPKVVQRLYRRMKSYEDSMVPAFYPDPAPEVADPAIYGGFWSPGWCTAQTRDQLFGS